MAKRPAMGKKTAVAKGPAGAKGQPMGKGKGIDLANLTPAHGARRKPKRIGRGPGSGHGKTATRGHKGQRSRSGRKQYFGFEGGQMPLHRRLPKRGFTNIFKKEFAVVNVATLEKLDGEITPERLLKEGIVRKALGGLKVLGDGELTKPLIVKAHRFSRSAQEKIVRAGGRAEIIAPPASTGGSRRA